MVIVYLVSDGLKGGFKCGIAGQYEIHTFRLRASHRTYHREAVSRLTDIQVCNESVELLRTDCLKGLGNRSGDGYVKPLCRNIAGSVRRMFGSSSTKRIRSGTEPPTVKAQIQFYAALRSLVF